MFLYVVAHLVNISAVRIGINLWHELVIATTSLCFVMNSLDPGRAC